MTIKKISCVILAFGILVLGIGALMPILAGFGSDASTSIVGGAVGPTYLFLLSNFLGGLPVCMIAVGLGVALVALFCLIFSKTVQAHCHLVTSGISLGLSATGALGLVSLLFWISLTAFDGAARYPIRFPAIVTLGLVSFVTFVLSLAAYMSFRQKHWTVKGIAIDVLTAIVFFPIFFFIFSYILSAL